MRYRNPTDKPLLRGLSPSSGRAQASQESSRLPRRSGFHAGFCSLIFIVMHVPKAVVSFILFGKRNAAPPDLVTRHADMQGYTLYQGIRFTEGSIKVSGVHMTIDEWKGEDSQCVVVDDEKNQAVAFYKNSTDLLEVHSGVCMQSLEGFVFFGSELQSLNGVDVRRLYATSYTKQASVQVIDGEPWMLTGGIKLDGFQKDLDIHTTCEQRFKLWAPRPRLFKKVFPIQLAGRRLIEAACQKLHSKHPVQQMLQEMKTQMNLRKLVQRRLGPTSQNAYQK